MQEGCLLQNEISHKNVRRTFIRMEIENATSTATAVEDVVFSTYGERQLIAAFYGVVAVVGTVGNCLVLLAVLLSRKLRTVPNVFVVNLSIADLISSLSVPWQAVAVLSVDKWPLPDWVCTMGALGVLIPIGCSLDTLALIAVNRVVLITRTKATYQRLYRRRWIAVMVIAAWALPLTIASLPLVSHIVEFGFDSVFGTCGWDSWNPNSPIYALILAVASYPVQLCTIIACYLAILVHLCKHHKALTMRVHDEQASVQDTTSVFTVGSAAAPVPLAPRPAQRNHRRRQIAVTKNLFFVVCAFFLCTTPYAICIMLQGTQKLLPYVTVLLFANSCLNPFIYATKHPDFKKAFGCMLRFRFRSIP
ncbi:neuropeptides B/W receptor type 2-like [Patiria miniata]|uniref:G-protein coupled receptors family 1 profile domain-containing protein n=1 Tax=Patiria miniata TaxID=46514 RepID=A0A913ZTQ1_PATMI|nr:neuropeptides B/W receptor type 2-like [Patiria miniata]